MRTLLMVLVLAGSATGAHAEEWGFSPGIKLAWTPGRGITYGIEVSVIRLPDLLDMKTGSLFTDAVDAGLDFITHTYGVVFNLDTNLKGLWKLRVGGEWVGPFIGLEAGPCVVFDPRYGTHLGLGFTPWAGYTFFGFYTYTHLFGDAPSLHEFGGYLKSPLLGFGHSEGHHLPHIDD